MGKLLIWGEQIPYNSSRSKLDDMDVHEEYTMEDIFQNHPGVFDSHSDYTDDMSGNDTMVFRDQIQPGHGKETYEDEPYLIPYIVPGSDKCVISCPGGAYLSKSMDNEGEDVAAFLNAAGISCFVLWYRSYPYRSPVMFRDCQRAIRYVRYHANEYGIDPEKIGIVGFSAGGNLCGTTVEVFRNTPVTCDGYVLDEVDQISAHVNLLGMVYPAITFEYSKIFLACIEGKECLKDIPKRDKLAEYYTLKNHIQAGDPPTFLCSALDDDLIPPLEISEYASMLAKYNVPFELHVFEHGGHGFGGCKEERINPVFQAQVNFSRVKRWMDLFASWVIATLDNI